MVPDFIEKYFKRTEEYPHHIADDILPWGLYWQYVPSMFLNAFINYVDIEAAYVLDRYHKWDNKEDSTYNHTVSIREPPGTFNWVQFKGTKEEIYNKVCEKGRTFHAKMDQDFGDDVLVLARSSTGWFLFWFDRDCSDSCIGRFTTGSETVVQDFHEWVANFDNELGPAKPIPLHYFTGWLGA